MPSQMKEYRNILESAIDIMSIKLNEEVRKGGVEFLKKGVESGEKVLQKMEKVFNDNILDKDESVSFAFEIKQIQKHIEILKKLDVHHPFTTVSLAYIMGTSQAIVVIDRNGVTI